MRRGSGTEPVARTLLPVQLPMSDLELSRACTERGQGTAIYYRSPPVLSLIQKHSLGKKELAETKPQPPHVSISQGEFTGWNNLSLRLQSKH